MNVIVLHIVTIVIVLIFALYEALYVLVNAHTSIVFKVVSAIVVCAVVFLAVQRDTYLPFLGQTALPKNLLRPLTDKKAGDIVVKIDVDAPDDSLVVYWASKPSTAIFESPRVAYADSENIGVSVVKAKSTTFYVACPASYKVPMKTIRPHIHYRIIMSHGLISAVKTVNVNCV